MKQMGIHVAFSPVCFNVCAYINVIIVSMSFSSTAVYKIFGGLILGKIESRCVQMYNVFMKTFVTFKKTRFQQMEIYDCEVERQPRINNILTLANLKHTTQVR